VSVTGGTLVNTTDYDSFTNPTVVNFADGVMTGTVHIQLKTLAANKLPGTILLGLSNPTGGAALGAQPTATVNVVAASGQIAFSSATMKATPLDSHANPNNVAVTLSRTNG